MEKQVIISKLLEASDAYYNGSAPIMSDAEYDKLYDEFKLKYPNDPFLKTIGAPISPASKWEKATHKIPMGSLNKVVNETELKDWTRKNNINYVCVSEKLDGISLDIEYEDGKLVKAITRGDGTIGEDITKNVINMENVRLFLKVTLLNGKVYPFEGSLRGEIILKQKDFESVVALQKLRNEEPLKNLRNGASGIAKRYDGKYSEYLSVIYYDITEDLPVKSSKFLFIENILHLPTSFVGHCSTDFVKEIYTNYEEIKRIKLDYEIDGLVVEIDDLEKYKELGEKDKRPKGAVAYKFTSMKKETKVLGVTWQLGKSGTLTPVAELEPVEMGGVEVKRASLHNFDNFRKLNLHENDVVLISRRGDVIPYVERVVKHTNYVLYKSPEFCPVCKEVVIQNGKFLVCENEFCDGAIVGDLKKWVNITEMQSLGIGEKTIEKLYGEYLISYPKDFYKLKSEDIENLDGFGKKSAEKIIEIIQSKKELPLNQFIGGLNIRNFSTSMTDLLIENGYNTLDKILSVSYDELVSIKGIEEKTALDLLGGLDNKLEIIEGLLQNGVKIKEKEVMKIDDDKLDGMSFCFTGGVQATDENGERYARDKLHELVVKNGGIIKTSVQNGLNYLVQADPSSQSSKTRKALNLGVKIISDIEFLKMIGK